MANEENKEEKPIEEVKPIEYNLKPEVIQKNKKLERLNASLGNNMPTKAKLTNLTFTSFKDNLEGDGIVKVIDSLNSNIGALRDKITEEATKKAEEEARKESNAEQAMDEMANLVQAGANRTVDRKKIENILALKLEAALTRASNPENVNPILSSCLLALKKPSGNSFELGEGQIPKAIMIPAMLKKYISKVGNNIQKYEGTDLTVQENKTDKAALAAKKAEKKAAEEKREPKWKKAFGNVKKQEEVIPVVEDAKVEIISVDSKLTSDELRERRTLAEAGESLSEIKRLEQGIGLGEPFNNGLRTRKRDLRKIIGEITGVQLPEESNVIEVKQENTEFQNRLEEILGIKEAPTKQEHEAAQEKYEEYFNDPNFVKQMERQKLEGILYDINTPEFSRNIDEAERVDNEKKALHNQQTNMEIIGEEKEEPKVEEPKHEDTPKSDDKLKFGLRAKKIMKVFNLKTEGKKQGKLLFEKEQKEEIKDSAEKEANRLFNLNKIVLGAELLAKDLFKHNQKVDLLNGAEEQAKALKANNDRADLIDAAHEQAKKLEEENEKIEILDFAEQQAKSLKAHNDKIEVLDLAEEQAKKLKAYNDKIEILNLAEKQAKELKANNDKAEIMNGAEEQARMLKNRNDKVDLLNSAEEQARMLKNSNDRIDLLYGAEEQARMLKNKNEKVDLLNAAEEQAKVLKNKNDQIELLMGAEEQAVMLKNKNDRVDLLNAAEEQAAFLQRINLLLEAADLQARTIFNSETQTILGEEAKTQAQQLFERDQMMEAKIKAMEEKKKKELEQPSFEFTDSRSKYAEIAENSKPIRLVKDRFDNLYKLSQKKYNEELSNDDTLVSLNEVFNDWEASPRTV